MEVFSLEDDGSELFITQSNAEDTQNVNYSPILGDGRNFQAPLVSVGNHANFNLLDPQYDNISDDDFDIPSSQVIPVNNR